MTSDDVKNLLVESFSAADIHVEGEGAKFLVEITSDAFLGKRAIARQQMVYAVLNDHISSGEIHAVTMNLKANEESA